ncbi:hypothetical protein ACSBR2_034182 [Camellia fascicularis]
MVETILFSLASRVVKKIGSIAIREVGLEWGVEEELKTLEGTLSTVKALLLDAERLYKQASQEGYYSIVMGVWFERLQTAIYEADNLLNEFQYEALRRQVLLRMNDRGIGIQVRKFFSSSHTLAFRLRFKMSCKIKKIRKRLDMIAEDRTKFHLITTENVPTHTVSSSVSSLVNESEFVGRDNDRERILELLMNSNEKISVISIVGIGGLGKTTLVKLLYNNKMVVDHFELRVWVRVAQDFNVKNVMQKIIQCVTDSDTDQSHTVLQKQLGDKRFLLVLDDVCNCDNRDWVKFFRFLRGSANGSKIIVTTRNKLVAATVATVPVYNLESLSDEDCHELLLKWAGHEKVGEQHGNQLSELSKEIVKKCHRNPLAAKTLGNNLFMKTDESEWLHLKEKELWELVQKKHDILAVLRLSYDPLHASLKRCFIYCSIFPKNYEIEIDKLKQLWMAQGFIQASGLNHELEDIGDEYLNQLCSIFFLEKIENQHGNLLKMCRMPEIFRDLAVFMANEECLSTEHYHLGLISERVKHVSFRDYDCSGEEEVTKSLFTLKHLHTIFFPFRGVGVGGEHFVEKCNLRFEYLHVLDLNNSCFQVLPHSIGNLKHLRLLDLSWNANIETLPNSISKLYNLQTLRIWYCFKIRELPKNIGNLISLRHLYLTTQQNCLPEKEIQRLTSLRSFQIIGCGNLTSLPDGMRLLVALRTVTITSCPKLTCLPSTMKNLAKLENLEISNCPNLNLSGWEDFRGLRRLQ